jgi:hypothetical protein
MNPDVNETLRQQMELLDATDTDPDFQPERFWNQLDHQLQPPARTLIWHSKSYWAHAAAFLIGGFLLAFWLQSGRSDTQSASIAARTDTSPIVRAVPEAAQPVLEHLTGFEAQPAPESGLVVQRTVQVQKQDSYATVPEPNEPVPVPVVVRTQPVPEAVAVAQTVSPVPRALYLTDAAPQATQLVAEKPQHAPTLKRPFFLSAESFETQTALQRPVSVWEGLRP